MAVFGVQLRLKKTTTECFDIKRDILKHCLSFTVGMQTLFRKLLTPSEAVMNYPVSEAVSGGWFVVSWSSSRQKAKSSLFCAYVFAFAQCAQLRHLSSLSFRVCLMC